jgi:ATP synthase mitochondrial F1 complex assembly factor 1
MIYIQPLETILNLQKLMATPHTPAQIGALWQAYRASRSGGTGAGYICACVPLDLYKRMEEVASRYPAFVFPLPRQAPANAASAQPEDESAAHEFFFMQWDFFDAPPTPSASEPDLFAPPAADNQTSSKNPRTSAILFTSLEEYKLRGSFATPYLVITNYTDLAESHGVVLLRGEITPSKSGQGFMLPQQDAQILAMGLQKFYLWNQEGVDASESATQRLLKTFHEKPEEFKWEELLEQAKLTA